MLPEMTCVFLLAGHVRQEAVVDPLMWHNLKCQASFDASVIALSVS